ITALRFARLTSASISARSTAAVDSRSSHSAIGSSVSFARLRAKARVAWARGPSVPSMLIGSPTTKPTSRRPPASLNRCAASSLKRLRKMVSTGIARRRSGSLAATPRVLVPRSRPISAPRAGRSAAASVSARTGMAGSLPRTAIRGHVGGRRRADFRERRGPTMLGRHAFAQSLKSIVLENPSRRLTARIAHCERRRPMAFTVISDSFKDGDYLPSDFILSADFGFGCAGGNKSPHLKWSGAPAGTQSIRHYLLRSRRADRLRLLALAGGEHPGERERACRGRGQCEWQAARGRVGDTHRFRCPRLWRPVPARGRSSAPLSVHGVCREGGQARRQGRHVGGGRRLQFAFQYAGEGGNHGVVQEVTAMAKPTTSFRRLRCLAKTAARKKIAPANRRAPFCDFCRSAMRFLGGDPVDV